MNQLLLQYSYLQVLDFLTTLAFMINGVQEGNPLVRLALRYSPEPLSGLLGGEAGGNCSGLLLLDTRPGTAAHPDELAVRDSGRLEPGGPDPLHRPT